MQTSVEKHYSRANLFDTIITAFEQSGTPREKITIQELPKLDEFHVRGLEASKEVAGAAGLKKDMKLLDIGCGIGGPARMLANEHGCLVTGIDLTAEFVVTANRLTELVGLADRCKFIRANATDLPFDDNSFDAVWTQHAQMNISDKDKLISEVSRVLKNGGRFIYYDIFRATDQAAPLPLPWAEFEEQNHLVTSAEWEGLLKKHGLLAESICDQTPKGKNSLNGTLDRIDKNVFPPVSLKVIIGNDFVQKLRNLRQSLEDGLMIIQSGVSVKS